MGGIDAFSKVHIYDFLPSNLIKHSQFIFLTFPKYQVDSAGHQRQVKNHDERHREKGVALDNQINQAYGCQQGASSNRPTRHHGMPDRCQRRTCSFFLDDVNALQYPLQQADPSLRHQSPLALESPPSGM